MPLPFNLQGHGNERRVIDLDADLLDRSDQKVVITIATDNRREQLDHRLTPDWRPQVVPGAIASDAHVDIAAECRVPQMDWRQPLVRFWNLRQQVVGFARSTHVISSATHA
ncbi:hypothetical protein D9M73_254800 [compost metagenome]